MDDEQQPASPKATGGVLRRYWKRIALGGVALFVVASLGRSLVPALGVSLPSGGKGSDETTEIKKPPPPAATLNGVKVLGGGAPMITLNPGLVRPDTAVLVTGSGFDAGSRVDVLLADKAPGDKAGDKAGGKAGDKDKEKTAKGKPVVTATATKDGSISASFTIPAQPGGGDTTREITAQQRGGNKVAKAEATMAAGAAGEAKLSATTGKPGDTVTLTAEGFSPGEDLSIYWGRINGTPNATLHTDTGGSVRKAPLKVGVSAVGTTSLVIVGAKSGAAASVPFQVLSLYPTVAMKPYAIKGAQPIGFSGKGFAPGERVLVRLNSAGGDPVLAIPTDQAGGFSSPGFVVPFELTGRQSLVFTGEQTRTTVSGGFTVLPYQPQVRASAYGGLPGTALTFYVADFAPNEAVHVFVGRTKGSQGELVAAFRTDGKGKAGAGGTYTIPGDASNDLTFTLVGASSKASASTTVKVDASGGPVEIPSPPKYTLPPDLEK